MFLSVQVIPATLLFVYGFFLYLHSIHTHYLLSTASLLPYLHPPTASKLLATSSPHQPRSLLSRLLINRRLQNIAYLSAILLAATHATIELVLWDGQWMHMSSLQHSTMYFLVVLCAFIGLGMDSGLLPYHARYSVGLCFWLCGFMFYSHAQEGLYNDMIHKMVSYLFWAAGGIYIFYASLLAACYHSAAIAGASPTSSLGISPVLLSFTATASRLASLFIMLSGSWLFHIAFAVFSPFAEDDIVHPDHDAHTLYLQLAWHFLTISTAALFIEALFRYSVGEWPKTEGARLLGRAGRVQYLQVSKETSDAGWKGPKFEVGDVAEEEEDEEEDAMADPVEVSAGKRRAMTNGKGKAKAKLVEEPISLEAQEEMDMI